MPTAYVDKRVTIDEDQFRNKQSLTKNVGTRFDVSVPAAKTGTLTTRTDNTTGTLTMSPGHGFITGVKIDIFWTDPTTGLQKRRYDVLVGTVSVNTVPISAGTGDDLPLAASAVTGMIPVLANTGVPNSGNSLSMILAYSPVGGILRLVDGGMNPLYVITLRPDLKSDWWDNITNPTNPVAGDTIAGSLLSHGDSTGAQTISGWYLSQ